MHRTSLTQARGTPAGRKIWDAKYAPSTYTLSGGGGGGGCDIFRGSNPGAGRVHARDVGGGGGVVAMQMVQVAVVTAAGGSGIWYPLREAVVGARRVRGSPHRVRGLARWVLRVWLVRGGVW